MELQEVEAALAPEFDGSAWVGDDGKTVIDESIE